MGAGTKKRKIKLIYAPLTFVSKTLTNSAPFFDAVVGLGIARPPFSVAEFSIVRSRLLLIPCLPSKSNGVVGLLAMNCNRYVRCMQMKSITRIIDLRWKLHSQEQSKKTEPHPHEFQLPRPFDWNLPLYTRYKMQP